MKQKFFEFSHWSHFVVNLDKVVAVDINSMSSGCYLRIFINDLNHTYSMQCDSREDAEVLYNDIVKAMKEYDSKEE